MAGGRNVMPELRWILIGFAIVLLAGIYLWGRRNSLREAEREGAQRVRPEPGLFEEQADAISAGHSFQHSVEEEFEAASGEPGSSEDYPLDVTVERKASPAARSAHVTNTREEVQPVRAPSGDTWRGRVEPTFADSQATVELPVENQEPADQAEDAAPTLSSSDTPAPRRVERRKILSLRLSASPHRIEGTKLLEAFEAEALQHGKYGVYHRLHEDGASVFSVASMVEPGTFDPEKMPQAQYPGITMFAQLPAPVPGMHALNELVACARRLQQFLGGTLQDDRGVPLTVHRIERMRQEVREFERPLQSGHRGGPSITRY